MSKLLLNKYPSPILINDVVEDENGEKVAVQKAFMPGELKEIDDETWEYLKQVPAVERALLESRMVEDPTDRELKTHRNQLANNFLDRTLIGHHCEPAREMDMEQVAEQEEEDAMQAIRKIRQRQNIRVG